MEILSTQNLDFFILRRDDFKIFCCSKYSSKVPVSNFGLKDPRAAQVMERKKIRPVLEKQGGLGPKYFHWGKYIKGKHTDFLEYIFPFRHLSLSCFPS